MTQLAEQAGVSYSTVYRIIHGYMPSPGIKTVEKIEAALKELTKVA